MRSTAALPMMLCLALGSCSKDSGGAGEEATGAEAGSIGSGGTTDSASGGEAGTTAGETAGGTTGVPFDPIPARGGIQIVRVEATSGVAVPIGLDGNEVGGAGRNAYLPRGRDTLVRAFLDIPEDWVDREIEARLTLLYTDGPSETLKQTQLVNLDTTPTNLNSGFYFGLTAAQVRTGMRYSVELWEVTPLAEGLPEQDPPARMPYVGDAIVGIENSYQNMRVVLVPVQYSYGDCQATPATDAAAMQGFEDLLFESNGLESIEFTIHAPMPFSQDLDTMSGLNSLVSDVAQLRAADNPDPEVYYYGLFDSCGACINDGGGVMSGCIVGLAADITGPDKSDAYGRASGGQLRSGGSEETFVHEIGHTQGRRHIACPNGGASGTDPSYPHADGEIGVWGFGIRTFKMYNPTVTKDYMSYCSPTWVSDWQWNATYDRARTLSSWETGDSAPGGGSGLLVGNIDPAGSEAWWTVSGELAAGAARSATHRVEMLAGTEVVASEWAKVSTRPHYPSVNVVVPLPERFHEVTGIVLHDEITGDSRPIPLRADKQFHRVRTEQR